MADWRSQSTLEQAAPTPDWRSQSTSQGDTTRMRLGGWRENIIGEGAVDTPGEVIGDVIGTGAAGIARGVRGMAELPEMAGRAAVYGGQFLAGVPREERVPVFDTATGRLINRGYSMIGPEGYVDTREGQTRLADYAGTIGEFVPGALGGGAGALKSMVAAGAASETAGQLTEGTEFEQAARLVGAFAPSALKTLTPKVLSTFRRGGEYPSVEALKAAKNQAYKAADDAGVTFSPQATTGLSEKADDILRRSMTYLPDTDAQTAAAAALLKRQAGQPLTLGQLDSIRKNLWARFNKADDEVEILDIIREIDDLIATTGPADDLMQAARLANSRFSKAQMLDDAFTKASLQTAATGSGGNLVNKYRQAITSIITNPKKAKWFSKEELDIMEAFVRADLPDNALRLMGKLSPSGNGLMAALNLGAVYVEPSAILIGAGGAAAQFAGERRALQSADDILKLVSTGIKPEHRATFREELLRLVPGLSAQQE